MEFRVLHSHYFLIKRKLKLLLVLSHQQIIELTSDDFIYGFQIMFRLRLLSFPRLHVFFHSYFIWFLWRYRFVRDKCFLLLSQYNSWFFFCLRLLLLLLLLLFQCANIHKQTNLYLFSSLKTKPELCRWRRKKAREGNYPSPDGESEEKELILCWSINAIGILLNVKRCLSDKHAVASLL